MVRGDEFLTNSLQPLQSYNDIDLVVCAGDPVDDLVDAHLHQVGLASILARRANISPPPKLLRQH